jgi:beta-lactam-binding protein with PASTA domain
LLVGRLRFITEPAPAPLIILPVKVFFRLALLCLVLVAVALVSALAAMHFAIHVREVTVPQLVGLSPRDAERSAAANGLGLDVGRQYYSSSVPEGRIMSQVPPAGTKVRRGWQVRAAQSLGPQRVAIPNVTGQTLRAAQINIDRRGLDLGAIAILGPPDASADQVLAQSPPPNASGVSAPRISLLLTGTPEPQAYVMPNFVGQTLGSVTAILQSAGLRVGTVTLAPPESSASAESTSASFTNQAPAPAPTPSPQSLVLSHSPAAGQKIVAGSAVNLEVSR